MLHKHIVPEGSTVVATVQSDTDKRYWYRIWFKFNPMSASGGHFWGCTCTGWREQAYNFCRTSNVQSCKHMLCCFHASHDIKSKRTMLVPGIFPKIRWKPWALVYMLWIAAYFCGSPRTRSALFDKTGRPQI